MARLQPKEPVSGFTHLAGFILSLAGLCVLIYVAISRGTPWHVVSYSIFGSSLILLYAASSLYHLLSVSERATKILRHVDHMMIYLLIAGSYTPLCLIPLRGAWGWSLLALIWVSAIAGISVNACSLPVPRWLYTAIYGLMGWLIVVALRPLLHTMSIRGFMWLLVGGLFYTVGAVFYALKWPKLKPGRFGFHELWHLFVMAGSFSHYWMMLRYVAVLP
jgi:hemolysin III